MSRDVFLDQLNLNNINNVIQRKDEKAIFFKAPFLKSKKTKITLANQNTRCTPKHCPKSTTKSTNISNTISTLTIFAKLVSIFTKSTNI